MPSSELAKERPERNAPSESYPHSNSAQSLAAYLLTQLFESFDSALAHQIPGLDPSQTSWLERARVFAKALNIALQAALVSTPPPPRPQFLNWVSESGAFDRCCVLAFDESLPLESRMPLDRYLQTLPAFLTDPPLAEENHGWVLMILAHWLHDAQTPHVLEQAVARFERSALEAVL